MKRGDAGFGVDLYRLEEVAKDHLPTVSMIYADVVSRCRSAEVAMGGLPAVPVQFDGDHGSVLDGYRRLSGAVTIVIASTEISLEETAEALHKAAVLYAETDRAAAAKLSKLLAARGEPRAELTA